MLGKFILGAAASVSALMIMPASAQAQSYYGDGYYSGRNYDRGYRDGYRRYQPGDRYGERRARRGYYDNRAYYGRATHRRGRYYRDRCGDGTTGAIVGGAAGALLGREVARDGRRYRNRGDGTIGAILGGAVGALVGREIDRGC